jgi:prepilin-type N-terminal cleavage/methylation domain-containing protein
MRKQRGFSLIELLIVVAIILIIAAIAIPNLLRSRISANEASAVASLRAISTAEISYATTYPNLGFADKLEKLGPAAGGKPTPDAAGLVDPSLAKGSKAGYTFTLTGTRGSESGAFTGFTISAQPTTPGQTGIRTFCSDQTSVLYVQADGSTCTPGTSPVLE